MALIDPGDLQRLRDAATSRRVAKLLGAELKSDGTGCCPLHEDARPSFKAYDGGGWKCFAGCGGGPDGLSLWLAKTRGRFPEEARRLAAELGITLHESRTLPFIPRSASPEPRPPTTRPETPWEPSPPPSAELRHPELGPPDRLHIVRDAGGRLFGAHARWSRPDGAKEVRWWRCGVWSLGGLKVVEAPLYGSEHLASYDRGAAIFVVEGETACDALHALGLPAVATVCGAGSLPGPQSLAALAGWRGAVILWADADQVGRQHMSRLASVLQETVEEVRIFVPEETMPEGGDAVDWIEARSDWPRDELREELVAAAILSGDAPSRGESAQDAMARPRLDLGPERAPEKRLLPDKLSDFLRLETPPRKWLAEGLIAERGLAMVHAKRGVGKTHFVLGLACAIASGKPFLRFPVPSAAGVLLVDGEMPTSELQGRLRAYVKALADPDLPLWLLSTDRVGRNLRSLATPEGQAEVEEMLSPSIKLLILDSVSTLCQNGDASENDAASWDAVQTWLLKLRRQGFAVLIVHHDGKDGRQRGTSKREDILDQVLHLKQPADYKPSEGTRFEAHLTKGRQVWGDLAEPFEASVSGADSLAVWTWKALRAADRHKEIRELVLSGATVRSIAEEVSLPSTTVYRAIQKMRRQGELPEEARRRKPC